MATHEAPVHAPAVEVEIVPSFRAAVVKLRGEHDLSTRQLVTSALTAASQSAQRVVIDFEECSFADSTLVKVLTEARQDYAGIELAAVIPPHATAARRLAELARLQDVLPVFESRDAALERAAGG